MHGRLPDDQKNARPTRVDIPVICIGNLNVGGTGKTPTTIAIAQMLISHDVAVHIVSRGYGGSLQAVTRVDPRVHTADETGDEPLLMAAFAPTWVANERWQVRVLHKMQGPMSSCWMTVFKTLP